MDPAARKKSPTFYGYIPDDGSRTVIFGCMLLNSALLLLIRSFSAAMLILVKKRYFALYLASDMALYLLQKVARGDFHYWIPIDGALGLLISLIVRVMVKILTDFTGVIHFRHPHELGGFYWTMNMFLALLVCFVSVYVYDNENDTGEEGVSQRLSWTLVGGLSGVWTITFALFLLLMKREYRGTFWSTKTSKQQSMSFFDSEDDAVKQEVMTENKHLWAAIRPQVKGWVGANYWRWEEERPAWFTESWIAKVPPDMFPSEAKQAAKDIRASARRRSSFAIVANDITVHPAIS